MQMTNKPKACPISLIKKTSEIKQSNELLWVLGYQRMCHKKIIRSKEAITILSPIFEKVRIYEEKEKLKKV